MDSLTKEKLLSSVATSTTAASTSGVFVGASRYHTLSWQWTPGTTSNVLTLKVFTSSDDNNVADADCKWAQEQAWTLSSTIKTRVLVQLDITGTTGGTAEAPAAYDFTINAKRIKVTYSETVSAGTLTAQLVSASA